MGANGIYLERRGTPLKPRLQGARFPGLASSSTYFNGKQKYRRCCYPGPNADITCDGKHPGIQRICACGADRRSQMSNGLSAQGKRKDRPQHVAPRHVQGNTWRNGVYFHPISRIKYPQTVSAAPIPPSASHATTKT